jgi:hypothetical protein
MEAQQGQGEGIRRADGQHSGVLRRTRHQLFQIDGQKYRVSNHTIKASNSKAYRFDELTGQTTKVRDEYHDDDEGLICFTASKTRLPEIYNALLAGKELDKRGYAK